MSTPLDVVAPLLDSFAPKDPREAKLAKALKELLSRQKFVGEMAKLEGPSLSVAAVAIRAGVKRQLVSHAECTLVGARELIVETLRVLSEHSLRAECEYLKEEVKNLRASLARSDSLLANRVYALHKASTDVEPTPQGRYSASDVRKAARLLPVRS
jgi:hypothetical protein